MTTQLKVRVTRKAQIKLKVLPRFPSSVTAESPITLAKTGGNYDFGLDVTALRASFDPLYATTAALNAEAVLARNASNLTGGTLSADRIPYVGVMQAKITGVNFNSANTDNAIAITLPAGFTRFIPFRINIGNASHSLTTATFGIYDVSGGTAAHDKIMAAATAITVSATTDATANNAQSTNCIQTIEFLAASLGTPSTIYFRVGTAEGAASTGDVTFSYFPAP